MSNRTPLAAALAALTATAFAQPLGEAPQNVAAKLKAMYPNTAFTQVRASQLNGLYELVMGDNIAYTDATGRYFIFGHVFDMQQQTDITAQRKREARRSEFPARFLGNAIKTVKGDGSRTVAIFSDPDCHYCKKLEGELARLDNVTIYTFLYPLEAMHPRSKIKAVSVWCAPDRQKAWAQAVLTGTVSKLVACNNPVNDNLVLGSRLGVIGTPTMIAVDGRVLAGAVSAQKLDRWLNATKVPGSTP